jgi:hypothetical protein
LSEWLGLRAGEDDMTDSELRDLWRKAGGNFHGPRIETGTMPEAALLPFLRGLVTAERERCGRRLRELGNEQDAEARANAYEAKARHDAAADALWAAAAEFGA